MAPRQRALFYGPPGVGKTTLSHHLSARLGLTMLSVNPDSVVSKYLGETAQRIGQLSQEVKIHSKTQPIVLLFDEFDAIAHKRTDGDSSASQERNHTVNTLLQRIERHDGIVIAATNHPDRIDPAIWRRFDMHIPLEMPGQDERERILQRYLAPFGLPSKALAALAESCDIASPALLRQFCEGIKRNIVLGPRLKWDMAKGPTIERIISSVTPHPDVGKPGLWSRGVEDRAIGLMPWPLQHASDIVDEEPEQAAPSDTTNVLSFRQNP
ncbi:MAG: ATP-binding protein [Devosia sp.]